MPPVISIEFSDEEIEAMHLTLSETIAWLENLSLQAINTDIDSEPLQRLLNKFDTAINLGITFDETFSRTHSEDVPV